MDDKGYTITPMAFLLIIPVIIFAVAFGDIVNEINQFSTITIGSDVTGALFLRSIHPLVMVQVMRDVMPPTKLLVKQLISKIFYQIVKPEFVT